MRAKDSLTGLDLKKLLSSDPMVRLGQITSDYFVISVIGARSFEMETPAGDRGDHLVFPIAGTVLMTQDDFRIVLTGGADELYFIRGSGVGRSRIALQEAVLVFVSFPRGFTETLQIWGMHPYDIPHREVRVSLLNNAVARFFLELVKGHAQAGVTHIGALEGTVRDLFVASLRANLDMPESSQKMSVKSLAMAYVFAEGLDPEVSVAQIAAKIHISPRHLQRAFGGGEKLSAMLLRHRAFHAEKLLTTASTSGLHPDAVARQSGFTSARSMNKGLLTLFGKTALQIKDDFDKRQVIAQG